MPRELRDMSSVGHAVKLVDLGDGLVRLVGDIVHERERAMRYYDRASDRDPATNAGRVPAGVKVDVYYQPAARPERFSRATTPKHSFLSHRQRLVVRDEGGLLSFYRTGPEPNAVFTPINCAV